MIIADHWVQLQCCQGRELFRQWLLVGLFRWNRDLVFSQIHRIIEKSKRDLSFTFRFCHKGLKSIEGFMLCDLAGGRPVLFLQLTFMQKEQSLSNTFCPCWGRPVLFLNSWPVCKLKSHSEILFNQVEAGQSLSVLVQVIHTYIPQLKQSTDSTSPHPCL